MEVISNIRELEASIIADIKNINTLLQIRQHLNSPAQGVQTACINSVRRVICHICDAGHLQCKISTATSDKFLQFKKWVLTQLNSYISFLCQQIRNGPVLLHALCIRTVMEMVKREYLFNGSGDRPYFGAETFVKLLHSLLFSNDIDVDILLMLKDEVFCHPDCCYFALLTTRSILTNYKDDTNSTSIQQNCLDLLRVIAFPVISPDPTVTRSAFLVNSDICVHDKNESDGDGDDDSDSGDDIGEHVSAAVKRKREKKRPSKGHSSVVQSGMPVKKKKKLSRAEQLVDPTSYKEVFSKAWISLMGNRLTASQHKAILKHLPEHVMPHLHRPMLLADYLCSSFSVGGVVAVLALESLFGLIVMYNLDYPKFFVTLYQLCNLTVFSAKYRTKFMKLLSRSLTSTNIPSYVVASFVKRLASLALTVPTPAAMFCIAQITQLLRDHPQCMSLLHRDKQGPSVDGKSMMPYCDQEQADLEKTHAIDSSLWELLALKLHHFYGVNALASGLESPASTESGVAAQIIVMDDFDASNYASLIEAELSKTKKNSALEFRKPVSFLGASEVGNCFGGNFPK